MSAVAWAEDRIGEWAHENALEDEAHQRNQQTARDFPPGTTIYLTGDPRPWIVDQRWMNGNLALTHQPPASSNQLSDWMILHAHNIWRIDPTR